MGRNRQPRYRLNPPSKPLSEICSGDPITMGEARALALKASTQIEAGLKADRAADHYRVVIHSGRIERGEPTDKIIPDDQRRFPDQVMAATWMREQCGKKKCAGSLFRTVEELVDSVEVEG